MNSDGLPRQPMSSNKLVKILDLIRAAAAEERKTEVLGNYAAILQEIYGNARSLLNSMAERKLTEPDEEDYQVLSKMVLLYFEIQNGWEKADEELGRSSSSLAELVKNLGEATGECIYDPFGKSLLSQYGLVPKVVEEYLKSQTSPKESPS